MLWWDSLTLFAIVQSVHGASNPNVDPNTFCYDQPDCDEKNWAGLCNTGNTQSPIDIRLKPFNPYWAPPTRFDLNKHYAIEKMHRFFAQNNGHSVQFDLNPNLAALTSELEIGGGNLLARYRFAQLHFHWSQTDAYGSEHTINGNAYPMEMHIVHFKSNYASLADALNHTEPDAVAVMAVFFKVSLYTNKALHPIVEAVTELEEPGILQQFNVSLRISDLYPPRLEFARYYGSLTTPGCDEKVIWTVFLRPVSISAEQMAAFRHLTNEEHLSSFNYRNPQPLNGRKVVFYKGLFTLEPIITLYSPITDLLSILFYFFQNLLYYLKP